MKKITLLLLTVLTTLFGYAQTELLNLSFDAAGSESIWIPVADAAAHPSEVTIAYSASGNGTGATQLSGVNTVTNAGRAYIFRYNNTTFNFGTSGTVSISMDLKIDVALSNANLVLETQVSKVGGGVVAVTHNNVQNSVPAGGGWTTLTFNMTPNPSEFNNAGTELYFFFIMAAGAIDGAGGTIFVDNIVVTGGAQAAPTCSDGIQNQGETGIDCGGPCAPCILDPTTGPINNGSTGSNFYIYSDLASNTTSSSDFTNFNLVDFSNGGITISQPVLSGNKVMKVENLQFFGSGFGENFNATGTYTYVHLNYYAMGSVTNFNFSLVDNSLSAIPICCGNPEEPFYKFGPGGNEPLVKGSWQSVFIPLSHFATYPQLVSGIWDGTDLKQTLFTGNGTVYIDNIYFSTTNTLGTKDFEIAGLNVFPNPSKDTWTVKTQNIEMTSITVYDMLGKNVLTITPNAAEATISGTSLKAGLYFAQIKTESGISSLKLVKQ